MTGLLVRDARLHLRVGNLLAEVHELLPAVHLHGLADAVVGGLVKVAAVTTIAFSRSSARIARILSSCFWPSTTTTPRSSARRCTCTPGLVGGVDPQRNRGGDGALLAMSHSGVKPDGDRLEAVQTEVHERLGTLMVSA